MGANTLDKRLGPDALIAKINDLERQLRELRTIQTQGESALQIGYAPDSVFTYNVAPTTGLIGTFICALKYDDPVANSVVFADLDIGVNKGTDLTQPPYALDPYTGGLKVEEVDSQYLVKLWSEAEGYVPKVKVVRLYTHASGSSDNYYIHCRWRYIGVGKTLLPATGDISILP